MSFQKKFPFQAMNRKTKLLQTSVHHLQIESRDVWRIAEIITNGCDEDDMTIKREEGCPLLKNCV
jgi:hypothetical protein